jgi:hypothetical protein
MSKINSCHLTINSIGKINLNLQGLQKPKASRLINTHILKANYPGMHYKYFITLILFFGIHQQQMQASYSIQIQ